MAHTFATPLTALSDNTPVSTALAPLIAIAEAFRDALCTYDDVRFATVSEPEQEPHHIMLPGTKRRSPPAGVTPALPADPSIREQLPLAYGLTGDRPKSSLDYDTVRQVFVEPFPDPRAGAPINDEVVPPLDLAAYMAKVGNLANPDYFDTAKLLMTTGLTNAGRDAHLQSRLYKGQVPWPNNKRLLGDINKLPHGPDWTVYDINLNEAAQRAQHKHSSYLFKRSLLATFQDLMANPEHKDFMCYAPRRDWTAEDQTCRVYGEMCSGDWWWEMQESHPDKFATFVLLIASFDRTVLSVMSGGQTAYPVLLTLANINKSVRRKLNMRGSALLAYLPVDTFANVQNKKERSRLKRELVHRALQKLFEELEVASKTGMVVACADGRYRKAYPVLAVGKVGPPRTKYKTLEALRAWLDGEGRDLADDLGLRDRPVWPWWASIPNFDLADSVMPDLLHQLHQGMIRHLLRWVVAGAGEEMLNRFFIHMPTAEGMRHYRQGVSRLTQWTGRESKEAAKQLLPIIASLSGKSWDTDFVRLARVLLEFTYRAQASRMTDDDLIRLEETVSDIHKYKSVLIRMNIFQDYSRFDKIIKLHMLSHYSGDTRKKGTPDGFSTETPEHSHVESKQAWAASNKVRPTPQMINFLQRYEALRLHRSRMNTYLGDPSSGHDKRRTSRVVLGEDEDAVFYPHQQSWVFLYTNTY
ncbi:hypothetical protein RhiJN_17063 [Ceratobasidium sp. AG-Ba]|nr:hypothetical protein RhiJN_17063 [Ceratobasidium sp. AG-Ba]